MSCLDSSTAPKIRSRSFTWTAICTRQPRRCSIWPAAGSQPDAVLVFDEFFNFPGWRLHEFRAWTEFVERTGRTFEYLAFTGNNEQVVVRLH